MPFHKKERKKKKKKTPIFFSWNFHTVFGEQIAISYQFFKVREQYYFLNVLYLQRCPIKYIGLDQLKAISDFGCHS